jgi:hypothetical protein
VREQGFKHKELGQHLRPFRELIQVQCRGYSRRLARIMVDFGADQSFGSAVEKIKEHYGIEVPIKACRDATLKHASEIMRQSVSPLKPSLVEEGVAELVSQSDGTMVPIVTIRKGRGDQRKRREVCWKEAVSTLAYPKGSATPIYAATLDGKDEAGFQMKQVAIEAGMGENTVIHAIGDGALWIYEKVQVHFGDQARFLIDFYHLCEYLAKAVEACEIGNQESYLGRLKSHFKQGEGEQKIRWLEKFEEPPSRKKEDAPVRSALHYVENRNGQFDYHIAIEQELPIGSGEIESSHRHLIQKRLKIAGAWWKKENANKMLQLRTMRANRKWNQYWDSLREAA